MVDKTASKVQARTKRQAKKPAYEWPINQSDIDRWFRRQSVTMFDDIEQACVLGLVGIEEMSATTLKMNAELALKGLLRRMMTEAAKAVDANDAYLARGAFLHLLHEMFVVTCEYHAGFNTYL